MVARVNGVVTSSSEVSGFDTRCYYDSPPRNSRRRQLGLPSILLLLIRLESPTLEGTSCVPQASPLEVRCEVSPRPANSDRSAPHGVATCELCLPR